MEAARDHLAERLPESVRCMNQSQTLAMPHQTVHPLEEAACGDDQTHNRRILGAAVEILRQGELLLGSLLPSTYAEKLPIAFNASIGGHYRHCLDHFTSLLGGLDCAVVDYDHRQRDVRIETQPDFALVLTRRIRAGLEGLEPAGLDSGVIARCEVSYAHGDSPMTKSSVGRELVYIIAHAIHHYALISVMARLQGVDLPVAFGVAPSTVAHIEKAAAC